MSIPISNTDVYRTISLVPGESFTLPPNASVVTYTGDLTSTCDILPDPEDLACYATIFTVADDRNPSVPYERVYIKGFRINDEDMFFVNSDINVDAGAEDITSSLTTSINTNSKLRVILNNVCGGRYATSSSGGQVIGSQYVVSFKAAPSLMKESYLIVHFDRGPFGSGTMVGYLPIRTRDAINATGSGTLLTTCPCSNQTITPENPETPGIEF